MNAATANAESGNNTRIRILGENLSMDTYRKGPLSLVPYDRGQTNTSSSVRSMFLLWLAWMAMGQMRTDGRLLRIPKPSLIFEVYKDEDYEDMVMRNLAFMIFRNYRLLTTNLDG
jgi:hypothetical protein